MPIDRKVFLREMALLAELFKRPTLSEPLVARYYETLSRHLSTEQFEAAAQVIFEEDQFWPTPRRFVTAAKGDPKRRAADAWRGVLSAAQAGRPAALGEDAVATLRRAGITFRDVETANDFRLRELERAFSDAHQTGEPELAHP